jgi:hypothetical protein
LGKAPKIKYVNNGSIDTNRNEDSSSKKSKPSKVDVAKKSDVVERYKEVNDALDDVNDTMTETDILMERLYGADRVKAMQKQNELIKDEIDLLEDKLALAKDTYLVDDEKALKTAWGDLAKVNPNIANGLAAAGITKLEIDGNGNITNYTDIMTFLHDKLVSMQEHYNALSADE